MNIILSAIAIALMLTISGCATTQTNTGTGKAETIEALVKAKGIHEECFPMTLSDEVRVSFESSRPLDYNIHYHKGDQIFYPVDLKGIAKWQGVFKAEKDDVYCLMWTNNTAEQVWLNGSYSMMPKPAKKP